VAVEQLKYGYVRCVVTLTGLLYNALSLGMVQFQGKFCSFVPKIFDSDASDPIRVGSVTGGIRARFCDLRL